MFFWAFLARHHYHPPNRPALAPQAQHTRHQRQPTPNERANIILRAETPPAQQHNPIKRADRSTTSLSAHCHASSSLVVRFLWDYLSERVVGSIKVVRSHCCCVWQLNERGHRSSMLLRLLEFRTSCFISLVWLLSLVIRLLTDVYNILWHLPSMANSTKIVNK